MRRMRTYVVLSIVLAILLGCGTVPKEDTAMKSQQTLSRDSSSLALVTDITKGIVTGKIGVTRVVIALNEKAKYSTLRNGNQLIVNIHGAKMRSSLKQLEVRDPVIKSVTAKQVGNTVKSVVDLVNQDIAYHLSKAESPFRIFVDIWQISPKTGLKQPAKGPEGSVLPAPVKAISSDTSAQRTQEVPLDIRETGSGGTKMISSRPLADDMPGQLQWFSEKLSQVLQEKEKIKQDLLETEKSFAVKDSMIQVLDRKLKEANTRIVEIEEELIKTKSKASMTEQNQFSLQSEIQQLLAQLEQVIVGEQVTPIIEPTGEELKNRSERIIEQISTLQQESISLSGIKDHVDTLRAQVNSLVKERDLFQVQSEQCVSEKQTLQVELGKSAAVENELRSKDIQLARVREALGAAFAIGSATRTAPVVTTPQITTQSKLSSTTATGPVVTTPQITTQSKLPSTTATGTLQVSEGVDSRLELEKLIMDHQAMSQTMAPGDYVLGPDDVVRIKVLNEEGLDKTVTVSSDGFITYPLLGDLRVDGLSTIQLDAQISSLLARDFLVDPEVMVDIVKPRSKRVYIMGAVKQPGYHELQGDQRLLGTMLAAGGPSSFETEVRVLRLPKGDMGPDETLSPIVIDLYKLFQEGDQLQNIFLQDGDVLMVAAKSSAEPGEMAPLSPESQQFYVVGSVVKPGIYPYKTDDTVLDAILRAGGFTEFAARNSTKVVRDSDGKTRTVRVKMEDVMEDGKMEKNIAVIPGDMIIVPESFF